MRGREDMAAAVEDFRAAVVVAAQAWRGPASAADRASETSPDAQPLSARVREHLRAARLSPGRPVAQLGGGRQWNGNRGHWRGRHWRGYGYGFAGGVALGALGSSYYYNDPYYYDASYAYAPDGYVGDDQYAVAPAGGGDAEAYCMQRYRSYDPASGTYLNYDGNRYPCP